MNSPSAFSRLGLVLLLGATSLAAGQALAQSQSMPGYAPLTDTGMAAPVLPPASAPKAAGKAQMSTKQMTPADRLDALSG
jgi:hypothetical protein